jgi:hypothetical protein
MTNYQDISADVLVDSIQSRKEDHHDTVYCNESHSRKLERYAAPSGLHPSTIDNLRIFDLSIEEIPVGRHPIVCRKGEVFPLAKDFKNESYEP